MPLATAPELRASLGDQVGPVPKAGGDGVKQFIQLEELDALHLPMRMLHLGLQPSVTARRVLMTLDFVFRELNFTGKAFRDANGNNQKSS